MISTVARTYQAEPASRADAPTAGVCARSWTPADGVRPPESAPAPRAGRRAGAHRALAEHERPQPRRGLRPPARALPVLGRRARARPWRRSRRRSGPAAWRRPRRSTCASRDPGGARRRRPGLARARADRGGARRTCASLPGVGRKTAACVLLFSFGRPTCPWTPTCSGVGTRLGLFRPGASLEEAHDEMLRLAPEATPTRSTCSSSATAAEPAPRAPRAATSARCGGMCPEGASAPGWRSVRPISIDRQEVHDEDERLVRTDRA